MRSIRPELNVTCSAFDSARSDQTTNAMSRSFFGKTETSHEHAARSPSSGRVGRERPLSERVWDRLPGVAAGVALAPASPISLIRAALG